MTILSKNLIYQQTRVDNLSAVKNYNGWGRELTDVSVIEEMDNIQVLSLSVNKIDTLHAFRNLQKLRELYLRKNEIKDLSDVCYLKNLKELRVLWLSSNPCADEKDYRLKVISVLPQLQTLDDSDVDNAERTEAKSKNYSGLMESLFASKKQQPKKKASNDSPSLSEKKIPTPKLPDLDEENEPEEKPAFHEERHKKIEIKSEEPEEEEEPEEQPQEEEENEEQQEEPIIARDDEEEEEQEEPEQKIEIPPPKPAPKKKTFEEIPVPAPKAKPVPVAAPAQPKKVSKPTPPQRPSPPASEMQTPPPSSQIADVGSPNDFASHVNKNSILKAILILVRELDNERLKVLKREIEKQIELFQ